MEKILEGVLRASILYIGFLVLVRLIGHKALAQVSVFEFILLLLVGEAANPALFREGDEWPTSAALILTLFGIDLMFGKLKTRFPRFDQWVEGKAVRLIQDGVIQEKNLRRESLDLDDIIAENRVSKGRDGLEGIKDAYLEKDGRISIIST